MKQGLKIFIVLLTIISIFIALFATSIVSIGDKQYFPVNFKEYRIRITDYYTYFYVSENGFDFGLRASSSGTGILYLNHDGQAVGSVPISNVYITPENGLQFYIENNGFNIMKIVDLINNHFQFSFPSLPSFDFSGGFFSDVATVVKGIFDLLIYPFDVTVYIINSLVGSFKLFGGGFKL